jgi:hypothetical protein
MHVPFILLPVPQTTHTKILTHWNIYYSNYGLSAWAVYLNCTQRYRFFQAIADFKVCGVRTYRIDSWYASRMIWLRITIPYSLYGNKIGGTGIQALAERLPHCTNPQNLE